jgi:transcriptional regulator with XRE-family HTH domain
MARKKRETFGAVLLRLRTAAGMSQYELARRSGVTNQAISYLEKSGLDPGWQTVQRLALALGLDYGAFADEGLVLPEYRRGKTGPKPKKRKEGGRQ